MLKMHAVVEVQLLLFALVAILLLLAQGCRNMREATGAR